MEKSKREQWVKDLKIGSEVWVGGFGNSVREKYAKKIILKETDRSWIVDPWDFKVTKYPKKTGEGLYCEDEVNDIMFLQEVRYGVGERVGRLTDADKLRRIMAILKEDTE